MSRLFNLKEWVTIAEASEYLSLVFSETVKEHDVLRLILDGHLTLSVNFVNHAYGKLSTIIDVSEITEADCVPAIGSTDEHPRKVLILTQLFEDKFLRPTSDKLEKVTGIWDIVMVGNGQLEVEHKYLQSIGEAGSELLSLDGVIFERGNQVFTIYEPKEMKTYEGESFTSKYYDIGNWFPSSAIPDNAVWCIKKKELDRFIKTQTEPSEVEREPSTEINGGDLAVVGAMLELLLNGKDNGGNNVFRRNNTQDSVANAIETYAVDYETRTGLSARKAKDLFARANKYLKSKKK